TLLPLKSSVEQHSWLVTTLAASVVIGAIILIVKGNGQLAIRSPFPSVSVLGARTPAPYLIAMGLALAWYVVLRWFYRRTLLGLSLSAVAQAADAARAAGLYVKRFQVLSFSISGLLIGTAGFASAPVISVASDSGIFYTTGGFVAAVVG